MSDFKLDFLCVGFPKCGTSSLHSVLKRMPELELPYNKKETCFFAWSKNYEDPVDMFQKRYFPHAFTEETRLIRGAVEPSFVKHSEGVRQYFGSDIKLVFMLRNPADAEWSAFKMALRRVRTRKTSSLYLKSNNDLQRMFRIYLESIIKTAPADSVVYFYDRWLNDYLKVYPKEQMHFILFEDFIQNYQKEMESLSSFLGFQISELPELHKRNTGDKISKDYRSAEINRILYNISIKARNSGTNHEVFWNQKVAPQVQRYTLMPVQESISEENRRLVLDYFHDSILHAAEVTGLPLEECWLK